MRLLFRWLTREKLELLYIGGCEVLPEPLNAREEQACIEAMQDHQDKEAKEKLIAHNLRLVVYIAKKFDNTKVGAEDLISIGTIGLMKAINTFDASKSIKLATYASRCIENEILMYLRKNNKQKLEVSIDEPLNVDWDGNELLLSDILGTDEDVIYRDLETQADLKLLHQALKTLNGREKMIIELRFGLHSKDGEELTQKQVADLLGISQSYISRLEKKRVALIGQNHYFWPLSYMAINTANMVCVPLDYMLPAHEIENLLIRSQAEAIIFDEKYSSK